MPANEFIEFQKVRDFGDVINVTFAFLRQNLRLLGKSLLFIVGPVALLGALSGVGLWDKMSFDLEGGGLADMIAAGMFGVSYFLALGLSLLASVLAVTVVNVYMLLYKEHGPDNFTIEDVWNLVKEHFWMMVKTSLFAGFVYFAGMIVSSMIFAIPLVIIGLGSSLGANVIGGVLILVASIAWLVSLFYFIVIITLLFPIRMFEPRGAYEAFERGRHLIKNNYGSSFVVLFVSGILMTIMGFVFSIPSYIFVFLNEFHSVADGDVSWSKYPLTLVSMFSSLGGILLYAIPSSAMTLQYFNLVEKKEKAGLMSRIDSLDDEGNDLF